MTITDPQYRRVYSGRARGDHVHIQFTGTIVRMNTVKANSDKAAGTEYDVAVLRTDEGYLMEVPLDRVAVELIERRPIIGCSGLAVGDLLTLQNRDAVYVRALDADDIARGYATLIRSPYATAAPTLEP